MAYIFNEGDLPRLLSTTPGRERIFFVSKELADTVLGGETGIAMSVVAIGEGVNADNIAGCIELLKEMDWDGVLSIECEAAPGKVEQSLEWLRAQLS